MFYSRGKGLRPIIKVASYVISEYKNSFYIVHNFVRYKNNLLAAQIM